MIVEDNFSLKHTSKLLANSPNSTLIVVLLVITIMITMRGHLEHALVLKIGHIMKLFLLKPFIVGISVQNQVEKMVEGVQLFNNQVESYGQIVQYGLTIHSQPKEIISQFQLNGNS